MKRRWTWTRNTYVQPLNKSLDPTWLYSPPPPNFSRCGHKCAALAATTHREDTGPPESGTTTACLYPRPAPFPTIAPRWGPRAPGRQARDSDTSPRTERRSQGEISSRESPPPEGLEIGTAKARMAAINQRIPHSEETPKKHSPQAADRKRKSGGSRENSWELDISRDSQPKERDLKRSGRAKEKGSVEYVWQDLKTNCPLRNRLKILLFLFPEIKLWILNINQLKAGLFRNRLRDL